MSNHVILPESHVPGKRLGRHVHFDERSLAFRVTPPATGVVTRTWDRKLPAFDQKSLGSCTGNAAAGLTVTEPFATVKKVTETTAISIYKSATKLDDISGSYPPDDTGSTVLAAMKALVKRKSAKSYHWCIGLQDVLTTLSHMGPISVGFSWYEGFDHPDSQGRVKLSGQTRGGHSFEILGVDAEAKTVTGINSWGSGWGVNGRFSFSWDDLDRLLHEQGEAATILV